MIEITFYSKAGCHLCDDVRLILENLAADKVSSYTEIDISSDPALFDVYRERIPVLKVEEQVLLEGNIEYEDLLWKLKERKGTS